MESRFLAGSFGMQDPGSAPLEAASMESPRVAVNVADKECPDESLRLRQVLLLNPGCGGTGAAVPQAI